MQGMYSMRSPAVKRLMKEAHELSEPTEQYYAQPLEDNLFEWHFTLRGPEDSEFEGGIYHGRIILPPDYPMKPPSIIILTPNGRFEINKKICLSISGHHPESWQPSWSIRTALLAIIGFMPTHGAGAIGSLDYTKEERRRLSKKSLDWNCPTCGRLNSILKPVTAASEKTKQEAKELAAQINFQGEKPKTQKSDSEEQIQSPPNDASSTSTSPTTTTTTASSSHQQTFFQFPGQLPGQLPGQFSGQLPGQLPGQFSGQLPGQFGFSQPPFPFPFFPQGHMPGQPSTVRGVARFPPPPPVIPAMLPPGFMPYTRSGSMFGSHPWCNVSTTSASATSPIVTTLSNTPAAASSSPPVTSSGNTVESTSSSNVKITESSSSELGAEPPVPKSEKSEDKSTGTDPSSARSSVTEPPASGAEVSSMSTSNSTENITDSATPNVSSTAPSTSREGLRQRPTVLINPAPAPSPRGTVGQTAELERPRQSGGRLSLFLIILLSIAIGLLLLRRLFLSRSWRFYNYGF